jgi:SagB-type dehydrogenase family enzyme
MTGCARQPPPWARAITNGYGVPVDLPPVTRGAVSLEEAIAGRQSAQAFAPTPLSSVEIGQLLWAAQGMSGATGSRNSPSAGALYPLELYVLTAHELMHYVPDGHRIEIRSTGDLRPQLRASAFAQAPIGAAPNVIVIAAVPARTAGKYAGLADAYVNIEVGHAAQNILLEATALGLAALPVGGLDPWRAAVALGLPPGEKVVYLIPVGIAS